MSSTAVFDNQLKNYDLRKAVRTSADGEFIPVSQQRPLLHPINTALGVCGGALTSTASVAMVGDVAKSNIPMLGYTVPYAVSNTLLTLWGMVIVLIY